MIRDWVPSVSTVPMERILHKQSCVVRGDLYFRTIILVSLKINDSPVAKLCHRYCIDFFFYDKLNKFFNELLS